MESRASAGRRRRGDGEQVALVALEGRSSVACAAERPRYAATSSRRRVRWARVQRQPPQVEGFGARAAVVVEQPDHVAGAPRLGDAEVEQVGAARQSLDRIEVDRADVQDWGTTAASPACRAGGTLVHRSSVRNCWPVRPRAWALMPGCARVAW